MRKRRKTNKKRMITISLFVSLFVITVGYSAFNTNINLKAKGNVLKDTNIEVDKKVPLNDLLFWGEANNKENTLTTLKNKANGSDGILNNFDNTETSGFNNDELVFDGVNDFVNIGYAGYDFKNSISLVIYVDLDSSNRTDLHEFFGNWEYAGGGIALGNGKLFFNLYDNNKKDYILNYSTQSVNYNQYQTYIGTFDGESLKLYINGTLDNIENMSNLKNSTLDILLGANPSTTGAQYFTKMKLKEAILYDRALTEDGVKTLTEGFKKKYENS